VFEVRARWVAGVLLALLSACHEHGAAPPTRVQRTAQPSAAVAGPSSAGRVEGVASVDAAGLLARVQAANTRGLVVNVWASWCGSCRQEIPLLMQLKQVFASEGIAFAFVTADDAKDYPRAVELMKSWGGPLPVLSVDSDFRQFKGALNPKWRGAIPATFLFDSQQKLRYFWEGPVLEHEVAPILQGFLAGEAIDGEMRTAAGPG
jgi:thiol-disulfide isomerase/thioredoxin